LPNVLLQRKKKSRSLTEKRSKEKNGESPNNKRGGKGGKPERKEIGNKRGKENFQPFGGSNISNETEGVERFIQKEDLGGSPTATTEKGHSTKDWKLEGGKNVRGNKSVWGNYQKEGGKGL